MKSNIIVCSLFVKGQKLVLNSSKKLLFKSCLVQRHKKVSKTNILVYMHFSGIKSTCMMH